MPHLRSNSSTGLAPDVTGDAAANLGTLNPIPVPRKSPPVFALPDISSADATQTLVFHAGGDSGGTNRQIQEQVAAAMATDAPLGHDPAFLLHLGDVMYGANKDADYLDRFYRAYSAYPHPIIAIPGNHDGEVRPGTDPSSLRAFWANFCAATATVPGDVAQTGITRATMTQPGVYWRLTTTLADIIGLYTNSGENGGTLEDGHGDQTQTEFLNTALSGIAAQRAAGPRKALVIATHHPPFSNSGHAGSALMLAQIDAACSASGIYPDLFLSGHAHNDQIHSRQFTFGGAALTVPYYVSGTLGFGLQPVAEPTGTTVQGTLSGTITYALGKEAYGYLIVQVTAAQITVTIRTMSTDGTVSDFDTRTYPLG